MPASAASRSSSSCSSLHAWPEVTAVRVESARAGGDRAPDRRRGRARHPRPLRRGRAPVSPRSAGSSTGSGGAAVSSSRARAARTIALSVVGQKGGSERWRKPAYRAVIIRESRKATTPRSSTATDEPAGALGQPERGVGGRDRHEAVAAHPGDRLRASRGERVVGPGERDPVDDDELARGAGHVDALPEGERAEEAGARVAGELAHERGDLVLALAQERRCGVAEPGPHHLCGGLRGAHRGEEPERAATGGPDQLLDLVELSGQRRRARAPGGAGHVGDRLLG